MTDHDTSMLEALRGIVREEVRREVGRWGSPRVEPEGSRDAQVAVARFLAGIPADGKAWRARELLAAFMASEHALLGMTLAPFGRHLTAERGRLVDVTRDRTGTHLYRVRGERVPGMPEPAPTSDP